MDPRGVAAERGLVAKAVAALTERAFTTIPFESLGPTKTLLKRFFSAQLWDEADDRALADLVGTGEGWWREPLDDELVLAFGWVVGRFALRVEGKAGTRTSPEDLATDAGLAATFDTGIVPEPTPNPRTLAFRTGPIHDGESRSYTSPAEADDPRVRRLFAAFPDLTSVLVARDFVALSVRRPGQWETLLASVLGVVAEEFGGVAKADGAPAGSGGGALVGDRAAGSPSRSRGETALERAWSELGSLRAAEPAHLDRMLVAARASDTASRQVAASLLKDAPTDVAAIEWARLAGDASRLVRRAAVDAMVDANRDELRRLLERALGDVDAWVRWKALRGLRDLGAEGSHDAIAALAADADFRVRLEAEAALRQH